MFIKTDLNIGSERYLPDGPFRRAEAGRSVKMFYVPKGAHEFVIDSAIPDLLVTEPMIDRYLELRPPQFRVTTTFDLIIAEIERAFVFGHFFAAVAASVVTIERMLNDARIRLHDHTSPKLKDLWGKGPLNEWSGNIDALVKWGYLRPELAAELKSVFEIRCQHLHSAPITSAEDDAHLVQGHTIGIDATTLEANAALRSIVRRDTGEGYGAFLTQLAEASGLTTPTRAELARVDRKRKKKGSNDDWTHPQDPDAKITKMKDGRTHLAHKAEHAVDLETGAVVGVSVQDADTGDTTTMVETLLTAAAQVEAVLPAGVHIAEIVGDKGYHSNQTLTEFVEIGLRSYISEPDRGRRNWTGKPAACAAVYGNRRRICGPRGQRLLRQRGERLERPNPHLYETGGLRRVHLCGHPNLLKRLLVHVCGFNLGLLMRQLTGVGTPRSLQGRAAAVFGPLSALINLIRRVGSVAAPLWSLDRLNASSVDSTTRCHEHIALNLRMGPFATGC